MLPKTLETYDKIIEILAGFPKLEEDDFKEMDLRDEETVIDLIKYLYMTLNATHTAMSNLRMFAELEMKQYIVTHFRKQAVN